MGHNKLSSFATPVMPSAHIIKKANTDSFSHIALTSTPKWVEKPSTDLKAPCQRYISVRNCLEDAILKSECCAVCG